MKRRMGLDEVESVRDSGENWYTNLEWKDREGQNS